MGSLVLHPREELRCEVGSSDPFLSPVGTIGCSQGRQPLVASRKNAKPRRGDRDGLMHTCRPYGACGPLGAFPRG